MLKKNFLIAVRRLLKNKGHAVVNILGLSIGLASIILMLFYIKYETTYDSFNSNYNELYRVERSYNVGNQNEIWDSAPYILAGELKSSVPEIENATNINYTSNYLTFNDKMYNEKKGLYADSSFPDMFTFHFIEGNKIEALKEPMSIIISESLANKIYDDVDIIGETLLVDKKHNCVVTGVFQDYPEDSHLDIDYVISYNSYEQLTGFKRDAGWDYDNSTIYVQLKNNANYKDVSQKIKDILMSRGKHEQGVSELLSLRPIGEIYLNSSNVRGGSGGQRSEITIIYMFVAVVIFTALITILNYINSSTAQLMYRELEIGIKKVLGSSQRHLISQFIAESWVMTIASFIVSIAIVFVALPFFNQLIDKEISFELNRDWLLLIKITVAVFIVGTISGLYPVFYLSSLKVSAFLHGNSSFKRRTRLRKVLVIFQLMVAIPLIFVSILITEQIRYIENKNIGFVKGGLLVSRVETAGKKDLELLRSLKTILRQNPEVEEVTISSSAPFNGGGQETFNWEGGEPGSQIALRSHAIDYDFIDTYKIQLVAGRDFSREHGMDLRSACMLNETAVDAFGWEDAIGKTIDDGRLRVIGVVEDFNDYTLFKRIPPMILTMNEDWHNPLVTIRVNTEQEARVQQEINTLFNDYFPNDPLEFRYLNTEFDSNFLDALRSATKMFIFFSMLAILLAVQGLYSLVSYSLKSQKKMIAVRKVLGASIPSLFTLMMKEYMILFAIAGSLGLISVYLAAGKLMSVFAYHVEVKLFYLLAAGMLALFVVIISVSSKIISASKENPIKAIAAK
ncbi:ABC transporter permease [Fulvivirga ligni]|uniref:ABC transporter permease n=1 Tax=Fulvivirga ligni TaxID=2904246 RepID=UPI001F318D01|nr:ABC transporter permease [Fulvivirga ligni]UII23758.1 ABC transporter permease [Fulvivirga ligni]